MFQYLGSPRGHLFRFFLPSYIYICVLAKMKLFQGSSCIIYYFRYPTTYTLGYRSLGNALAYWIMHAQFSSRKFVNSKLDSQYHYKRTPLKRLHFSKTLPRHPRYLIPEERVTTTVKYSKSSRQTFALDLVLDLTFKDLWFKYILVP